MFTRTSWRYYGGCACTCRAAVYVVQQSCTNIGSSGVDTAVAASSPRSTSAAEAVVSCHDFLTTAVAEPVRGTAAYQTHSYNSLHNLPGGSSTSAGDDPELFLRGSSGCVPGLIFLPLLPGSQLSLHQLADASASSRVVYHADLFLAVFFFLGVLFSSSRQRSALLS